MMIKKKQPNRQNGSRHSSIRRIKWWLRAKLAWLLGLKWWQKALFFAIPAAIVTLVIPLLIFFYFSTTMGDIQAILNRNNTGVVLQDKNGETFYSTGTAKHREFVPVEQISNYTKQALVASEDKNFFNHGGVSIFSTLRAIYGYIFSGGGEFGGSTLTQQLAKMTLLSTERGALRQYQAFSVAIAIERRYSKDEILAMYLNSAYFGNNSFGIDQAARNYFGKSPADLDLAESAMLVGVLPAPSIYSPVTGNIDKARNRQGEVLSRMVAASMISEADKVAALDKKLDFLPLKVIANDAPHFTEMVLRGLYQQFGEDVVERAGYQVTTTLDLKLQRQLVVNVSDHLGYIKANGGSNVAAVAIEPSSGQIMALVGSADWSNLEWGMVNAATSLRQPGSSFKPIYYSAALSSGLVSPATILMDNPIDIDGWQPHNADRKFRGPVSVRNALSQSLNIPSIEVMQKFGIDASVEAARKLGITSLKNDYSYGLSLALGSAEVPLVEMTNAYAAFANEGQISKPTVIKEIADKFNQTVYRASEAVSKSAISPEGAYLISSILSDNNARAPIFGSSLTVPGRTVAIKTGTTDEQRDALAIGYTAKISLGVWVGNNDNAPMLNGGSSMAAPIFIKTIQNYLEGTPNTGFIVPAGIVQRAVCFGQEALATRSGFGTFDEYFIVGHLPVRTCVPAEQPKPEESEKKEDKSLTESNDGAGGSENANP